MEKCVFVYRSIYMYSNGNSVMLSGLRLGQRGDVVVRVAQDVERVKHGVAVELAGSGVLDFWLGIPGDASLNKM